MVSIPSSGIFSFLRCGMHQQVVQVAAHCFNPVQRDFFVSTSPTASASPPAPVAPPFQSRPAGFFRFYYRLGNRWLTPEEAIVSIPSSGIFSFLPRLRPPTGL